MSGLTSRNQAGQSGLVAPKVDFQRFATAGSTTWTKPADVAIVWIECYGGGGVGGAGAGQVSGTDPGGGGGGGGAMAWACFSAAELPPDLDVVVGSTAAGASGGSSGYPSGNGTNGNYSQVNIKSDAASPFVDEREKVLLKAYGGGGGGSGNSTHQPGEGGGGGGSGGAGMRFTTATGGGKYGAVRIIWSTSGTARAFPGTNIGDLS